MTLKNVIALTVSLPLMGVFYGCAAPADNASSSAKAADEAKQEAASEKTGKAERKISQAIGEDIGNFKIVSRAEGDAAAAGFSEGIYTVLSNGGRKYKCSIQEPSGFMSFMSWGGADTAAAMCTDFTPGSKDQGKTNNASCNSLLQAAGKC